MGSQASEVFSAALEACRRLQQVFPADARLRSIVGQLEQWQSVLEKPGQTSTRIQVRRTRRLEPRDLRPIDEGVASLVHHAVTEATRLGLA